MVHQHGVMSTSRTTTQEGTTMTKAEFIKKLKEAATAINDAECLDGISNSEYEKLEEIRCSIQDIIEGAA